MMNKKLFSPNLTLHCGITHHPICHNPNRHIDMKTDLGAAQGHEENTEITTKMWRSRFCRPLPKTHNQ